MPITFKFRTPFLLPLLGFFFFACTTEEKTEEPLLKKEFSSVEKRKLAFFQKLYPIVEAENDRIEEERNFVLQATEKHEDGDGFSSSEKRKLKELARKYRVSPRKAHKKEGLSQLEHKIGKIPPELALIQAANESNWGRSRFAREGNNLFGQWCFTKGCGIVPKRRAAGSTHEVASFSSIDLSVRSYMKNLNSHPAYRPLRDIRAQNRKSGKGLSAYDMAGGLRSYAGIGDEYIKILRNMMKANKEILKQARS